MNDCIFCEIGSDNSKSDRIYQDDYCFVIQDINPITPTHLLVIPTEHIEELWDNQEKLLGHLLVVASKVAEQTGLKANGFRITINQGKDAGQTIPHLHMHLMGGRELPWGTGF